MHARAGEGTEPEKSPRPRSAEDEHLVVREMLDATADDDASRVWVWNPLPQVAFGRRDLRETGYEVAVRAAEEHGLAVTRRTAGGRAVVHTGATAAFAVTESAEARDGLRERYCRVSDAVEEALSSIDVEVDCREPEKSFCPGDHSLSTADGKVVGVAQRVSGGAALVSGVALVEDRDVTVTVHEEVYSALGLDLDPGSVSTLEAVNPEVSVETVLDAFERELVDVAP